MKTVGTASASSSGHIQGNRVGPGVVVGTYNLSEHGDGTFPDLNRVGMLLIFSL